MSGTVWLIQKAERSYMHAYVCENNALEMHFFLCNHFFKSVKQADPVGYVQRNIKEKYIATEGKKKNDGSFLWFKSRRSTLKSCGCAVYNQHVLSLSHQITDVPLPS